VATDVRSIEAAELDTLLGVLERRGYELIGPTVRDGAILYDRIQGAADLARGWAEEAEPGHYRLEQRGDGAYFGHTVGPNALKAFLYPPRLSLYQVESAEGGLRVTPNDEQVPRYAFVGARSCDLHAVAVHDRVLLGNEHVDRSYRRRREEIFVLAVNCTRAASTCFCASLGTGPKAQAGFDLALTEILEGGHRFVVFVGSELGAEVLDDVPHSSAGPAECEAADAASRRAAQDMPRSIDSDGLKELLFASAEHPVWDEVAQRCLACTNCTLVCPTCFCSTIEEVPDLDGLRSERVRTWDSCFNAEFSYLHGSPVRASTKSRYRQWLTHKLASWHDQFGTSGCVGCGRCIAWCPAGIDLTQEVRKLRAPDTPADVTKGGER
jgi:ferredoxin